MKNLTEKEWLMLRVMAGPGWREMGTEKEVGLAIDYADELIKQLKNEKI